ncbi:hypothetical protein HNY73_000909 [Argiope bruennichi]|uniref:Uncharacterized protein n=1 Tax=Argiope bruennichi TaxID=94029 RepID=A0A8T0G282_ARGBR|nr:hypothetical protein HNY73_000909 [Argiope bruennichi]
MSHHSESRSNATSDPKQLHEKNNPLKVGGNETNRRPENICKKNVVLSAQYTNVVQQDKNHELRTVPQCKIQKESIQRIETETETEKDGEKKDSNLKEHSDTSNSKPSDILCSCVCCMSDNEQIENTVKDLQNQIQQLTAELSNYKTENQLLRKDINRAKTVVKREIGRNVESFEELVKKMTEDSWIGQQEKIVSLKKELRELKEELKEKGLEAPSPVKRRESLSPEQVPNDRKVHWRLKLERESILRQTEREKQDLIEDRDRLKEKCEVILNRNKELEQQIDSIRQELKEARKDSNGNFISRLQEVEKKAKFCLEEKSRLRRSVEEEETKEKQLLKKIEELNTEIKSQKNTLENVEEILSKKKSDENSLVSSVTKFESEVSSGFRDIDRNLDDVNSEQKKNIEGLNSLIDYLFMFEELFIQQRKKSPSSRCSEDEISSRTSISTDTLNAAEVQIKRTDSADETIPTTTAKQIMQVKRESVVENAQMVIQDTKQKLEKTLANDDQYHFIEESTSLKDECNRFVKLLKDEENENLKKSERIYDLLNSIKNETEELLKNNSQLWRIAAQIKIMLYKNKKLRKLVKDYANALEIEQHGFCHETWDDLIKKAELIYNILGKESKFLKTLITKVAESKAYDFDVYTFACKGKEIFMYKVPIANKF